MVRVRVLTRRHRIVVVFVMPVVVTMGMVVIERRVDVRMAVPLGEVKREPRDHRESRGDGERARRLSEREGERGAPERPRGKDRGRASGADLALGAEVEAETRPVPGPAEE